MVTLLTRPDEIVDDLTRRRLLGGAALTALVAAGCAGGDRAPAPTPLAGPDYPRSVVHPGGTTRLDRRPERIYVARPSVLDAHLALGVTPVLYGAFPYNNELSDAQLARGAGAAAFVDLTDGVNLERMLAAGVDLVVGGEVFPQPEEIVQLARVAPVVALPDADVAGQLRVVGDCLALDPTLVRDAVARVDDLLAGFAPATRPASVALVASFGDPGGIVAYTPAYAAAALLDRLGLPVFTVPGATENGGVAVQVSRERFSDIAADVVIGMTYDFGVEGMDALDRDPLWAAVPAVRAGRYRRLDVATTAALTAPTALTLGTALDGLTDALG